MQHDLTAYVEWWTRNVPTALQLLTHYLLNWPLQMLYFNGPYIHTLDIGFWEGQTRDQICAKLTNDRTDSSFWRASPHNASVCETMVLRRYYSFAVTILILLYFCAMLRWLFKHF